MKPLNDKLLQNRLCHFTEPVKGKAEHLYSAMYGKDHFKALRHGSRSFTCNKHHACLTS